MAKVYCLLALWLLKVVLSVAMLLRYSLNLESEAHAVERAVYATLDAGIVTRAVAMPGEVTTHTDIVGAAIVERIQVH